MRVAGRSIRIDSTQVIIGLLLTLLAAFMALPIVFIFMQAFKPLSELFLYPPRFYVMNPTLQNFSRLLTTLDVAVVPAVRYVFNSAIATAAAVTAVLFVSTTVAYALSKHDFPGRKLILDMTIVALMFAPQAVLIPRFLLIQRMHLYNTYFAHVLPFVAAPVSVFLLKQFIDQVPNEMILAARVDGASEWQIIFRVVAPICRPALATVGLLAFQGVWNSMETSTYYIRSEAMKTLPFFLGTLTSAMTNNVAGQGAAAAAGLLMFLPNLLMFLVLQSKVVQTMAHSGLK